MSKTMKEVIVYVNPLRTKIIDSPIPSPKENEVLIKVIYTDSNPKDWKYAIWQNLEINAGDDIAGYVEEVGSAVTEFKKGDRVAAMHVMFEPHGSYAEYAIAPSHTTFHIPKNTSFQEATTLPLAAMTASLALYQQHKLPPPWAPAKEKIPLIIYGGSSAVGAFAIKLAKISNISPIIAVCGAGKDFVKSIGADVTVDYRQNNVAADLKAALNGATCYHAIDATTEHDSYRHLAQVVDNEKGLVTLVLPAMDYMEAPENLRTITWIGSVHKGEYPGDTDKLEDLEFGYVMYRYFSRALAQGKLTAHPQTIIDGGLNGVEKGLGLLMDGKVSATKYIYQVAKE